MTEHNQALMNRWLQGDPVEGEVAQVSLDEETLADWEAQSTIDTLLQMQEGRLALSSGFRSRLMTLAAEVVPVKHTPQSGRISSFRVIKYVAAALAGAACVVFGLSFWMITQIQSTAPNKSPLNSGVIKVAEEIIEVAPGWQCYPGGATYTIVSPGTIQLSTGELTIKAVPIDPANAARKTVTVHTANAKVVASDGDFNVIADETGAGAARQVTTRVIIHSGTVTVSNDAGTITGGASDQITVDGDSPPVSSKQ